MASEVGSAVGDLSLCEFARANRGSARLRNSLAAAELGGSLPFRTVGEYLASPAPTEILRVRVRSMGRRTALELDRMVRDLRPAGGAAAEAAPLPPEAASSAVAEVRAELEAMSLRELLPDEPRGTRLSRILLSEVGERSALEAIDEPGLLVAEALRLPAVGAGTAHGLSSEIRLGVSRRMREAGRGPATHDAVLAALFGDAEGPAWRAEEGEPPALVDARALLSEALDGVTVGAAFADAVLPVRLTRLLAAPGVADRPLAETLLDRARIGWQLARVPNAGRKTILEFWDLCWRRLAVALATREGASDDRAAIATLLDVEPARLEAHPEDLASHGPLVASASGDGGDDRIVIPRELDDLLDFLLARIRPQDAPVVRRRFGLDGGQGETLEEIGVDLGVTRERIRQLEKRGMGDLRVIARRVDLRGALDVAWPRGWEALADGDDLVTDQEFATFRRAVPAEHRLALELLDLNLSDWLSTVSTRYRHGWLAPHRDRAPVDAAIAALEALPAGRPSPRAVADLGLPGHPLDVEAALLIGCGRRVLHGYVVEGRIGTRRRRSLVAHAVLGGIGGPVGLAELLRAYHGAAPSDRCSSRDLTIVMSEAPHLFLEISEARWCALGRPGELPPGGRRREADVDEAAAEQDATVASVIRDELARTGPQPLAAITGDCRRWLPRDRSPNSVQPTLFTRPDVFARLLPGVYGLWSQIPGPEEVLSGSVPYLLDDGQARIFSMARRAGEPWRAFPLWSPEAEYRLCRWASREGSAEVRRSLLATATVDEWPVDAAERERWSAIRERDGRYDLLATVRPGVFAVRPDLDRVLAALVELEATGWTSWMALNRIDGRHVASQLGCGMLAVLVLAGAVVRPEGDVESEWQVAHRADRACAADLRTALAHELHERGTLVWGSQAGRRLAARVLDGERRAPPWVPFRRFAELFGDLEPVATEPVPVTIETVGEVGRALLAERRMSDLLDWLDAR